MKHFKFLFGAHYSEMLFRHTDNLSAALLKKTISAREGQHIGKVVNQFGL